MSDGSITLFTALPVPEELRHQFTGIADSSFTGRWTHPQDLHITLRYLGKVEPGRLEEIVSALKRVKCRAFGIEIGGISIFKNKKQKILYADVKSTRKLNHLCAEVTEALSPLGFDFRTRPYQPHVTIARLDKNAEVESFFNRQLQKFQLSWEASGFALYQSSGADAKESRYKELAVFRFPLRDGK